jgi:hypothetical protein
VPVERATACGYGVIFAIAPSPAADGVVWVGTDNGRVQLTRDDGKTWKEVTPPGMKDWTKVNIIDLSTTDPGVAYVAGDRHRLDDFRPMAWSTHDFGATWTEIGHGLPDGAWVGVVRHDPKRAGLLFAGTSRGIHVSFDDGAHWQSLQRNLPRTGINDLLIHGDDVIVATQGRALWALDDIEPLRHLSETALATGVLLVPPPAATRLRANQNRDTPLPPEEPHGANPPVGAILDYVLPKVPEGPVTIEIVDAGGASVTRFRSDEPRPRPAAEIYFAAAWLSPPVAPTTQAGHNRFVWDLRYPPPKALEPEYTIAAVQGQAESAYPAGAFVLPGRYEVRLSVDGVTRTSPLTVTRDPRVTVGAGELEGLLAFQKEVEAALAASAARHDESGAVAKRLRAALADPRAEREHAAIERALAELERVAGPADEHPDKVNRVLTALASDLESADAAPNGPQRDVLQTFRRNLERYEERWQRFAGTTLADLDRRLEPLGVGRP